MKILVTTFFVLVSLIAPGQQKINLTEIDPSENFENIHVRKLDTDSNETSFVIWVKKSVKAHYHKNHSECLHVLSGTAIMKVGKEEWKIKSGDYFVIPAGMVHSVAVTSEVPLQVISIQTPEFLGEDRHFVEDK